MVSGGLHEDSDFVFSPWALQSTMWLPPIPAEFPGGGPCCCWRHPLLPSPGTPHPGGSCSFGPLRCRWSPCNDGFVLHTNEQIKEKVIQKKVQYFQYAGVRRGRGDLKKTGLSF